MLKKLIVLVTLLALAVPVLASDPNNTIPPDQETWTYNTSNDGGIKLKAHEWPVEFKWVDFDPAKFKIPVKINVGLYVEISNKGDVMKKGILLEQKAINTYEGCSIPIEIKSNFKLQLGAYIVLNDTGKLLQSDMGKWKKEIRDETCTTKKDVVDPTLGGAAEKRTVWVRVEGANILKLPYADKVVVADVVIQVRPLIPFEWQQDP